MACSAPTSSAARTAPASHLSPRTPSPAASLPSPPIAAFIDARTDDIQLVLQRQEGAVLRVHEADRVHAPGAVLEAGADVHDVPGEAVVLVEQVAARRGRARPRTRSGRRSRGRPSPRRRRPRGGAARSNRRSAGRRGRGRRHRRPAALFGAMLDHGLVLADERGQASIDVSVVNTAAIVLHLDSTRPAVTPPPKPRSEHHGRSSR